MSMATEMTRQEAAYELQWIRTGIDEYANTHIDPRLKKEISALDTAISALLPITREQVEKVWKGEWECDGNDCTCKHCGGISDYDENFCPVCGMAMCNEAVDMVMERLEALRDEKG